MLREDHRASLRLRDLGGIFVIDFIYRGSNPTASSARRLTECLAGSDKITGRISTSLVLVQIHASGSDRPPLSVQRDLRSRKAAA